LVSIIGPNGAGKTTCLRALSGLLRTEGSIEFDGRPLRGVSSQDIVGAGIIQCPEGRKLFPDMTVDENLRLGAFLRRDAEGIRQDVERIKDLLPILHERRQQKAGTLSGGEQQMLAIGRSLMSRPRILMLDEPSFGIAPIIVDRIFEVIRQLNADGLTTLLVEQNVSLALDVSDRAYVLESGRVALSGVSSDLAADATVREAYLGM
ncbi:MAG TPA: ABC transporter ATP-binding protein, partial [Castellaniella sp.]|nr:ABC transporter ATP-binding protein [Castellaniella sp.]